MSNSQGMGRRETVSGDEVDAFDRAARKHVRYRAGERARIKGGANRRDRHTTRAALRTGRY
jgi:hypothetical protein